MSCVYVEGMETNNENHNNKGKSIIDGSSSSRLVEKVIDCASNGEFPAGLRVLLVDDDRTCLSIVEKMMKVCLYKVTKCGQATDALSLLRDDNKKFDIVVIDLHMPDMDGFKLLEIAECEMNLPVVMMSSDDDHEVVKKGVLHGACDYLIKPVRMEALRMIWQHVIRKKRDAAKEELEQLINSEDNKLVLAKPDSHDDGIPGNTRNCRSTRRRKNSTDDDDVVASEPAATRKKRMIWTEELHKKFVRAVDHLGGENAVPLKILQCLKKMNVQGITREHIASHLQKYRIYLRKQQDIPQLKHEPYRHARTNRPTIFEQSRSSHNLQFQANTSQFPLPNLTATQGSQPVPLNVISNAGLSCDGPGKQPLHPGILESSYYPVKKSSANDFPFSSTFRAGPSCKTLCSVGFPSLGNEYKFRNKENVAQNSQSLSALDSFDDLYDTRGDTTPQLIYEPSLYLQHFDQNEIFHGAFTQQGAAPLLIKYKNATQFDK